MCFKKTLIMNAFKLVNLAARSYILFSIASLAAVSFMAYINPQDVMDLVNVSLTNTDAFSSIRGVYGGVGTTLIIALFYLMIKDSGKGLVLLSLLWGFYALSRTITIFKEGALGNFGTQWLTIETSFFLVALILWVLQNKYRSLASAR